MRVIEDSVKTTGHSVESNSRSLGVQGKLLLGFSAITAILICSVITILIYTNKTENFFKQVTDNDLPIYHYLIDLSGGIYNTQLTLLSNEIGRAHV